jgi:glycosyltransferase involved in cell wall biosynthesis
MVTSSAVLSRRKPADFPVNNPDPLKPFSEPPPRATVCFVLNALPHYRERFFTLLRQRLGNEGVHLRVLHAGSHGIHNIEGNLEWAESVTATSIGPFTWLSLGTLIRGADLVVVPQIIKQIWIYPLLLRRTLGFHKIAFWGHGKVFSSLPDRRLARRTKELISRHCDWWFAYTERSAQVVNQEIGYPAVQITSVNNAVDTNALAEVQSRVTCAELDQLKSSLGIRGSNTAIFVGGMYHNAHHTKRLSFLITACQEIRKNLPDFEMIFVGGGPDQHLVEAASREHPWMHYVGVKKGADAVPYWSIAKLCLNPGLVGLGILDCLALGVPILTSDIPCHSPEIDYLESGVNGLMVEDHDDPAIFAKAAITLLKNEPLLALFADAGKKTAASITNEAMVEKFTDGILKCLNLDSNQTTKVITP